MSPSACALRGGGGIKLSMSVYSAPMMPGRHHRVEVNGVRKPINLVSHDVGMMVAYAYASEHAASVKRLVLTEAALPGLGLESLFDADKNPRMFHLPLFDAPNGLAEALIAGREKLFVSHMMRQQAYDTTTMRS